jgi:hypothetical protein
VSKEKGGSDVQATRLYSLRARQPTAASGPSSASCRPPPSKTSRCCTPPTSLSFARSFPSSPPIAPLLSNVKHRARGPCGAPELPPASSHAWSCQWGCMGGSWTPRACPSPPALSWKRERICWSGGRMFTRALKPHSGCGRLPCFLSLHRIGACLFDSAC